MATIFVRSDYVTYGWKYTGDDEILRELARLDDEKMKDYCIRYKIQPKRQLRDSRPVTMFEWDNLPAKQEMFGLARKGWFKVLLINNMGVLAESCSKFYDIVKCLQKYGVTVICVDEQIDITVIQNGLGIIFQESKKVGMLD